jgi:hypothetical protein
MPGIYFARIANDKSGFTNQIFALVNAILNAKSRGNTTIILDSFQRDFMDSTNKIPCSQVFDLKETNKYLKKYDITLICSSQFNYKLNAIFYGTGQHIIDITDKASDIIRPGTYNFMGGDPFPGVSKELFVNYTINGNEYSDIYEEGYLYNIWTKGTANYEYIFRWINNQPLFEDIMKNLKYKTIIDNHSLLPLSSRYNSKINVVHLRLEDDAINHWSKQNHMTTKVFKHKLEEKYIQLIRENIDPKQVTIVVGSKENKVIDFMIENEYNCRVFSVLELNGREVHAIFDLLQAAECNETFISNFNYQKLNGSSFSYYISLLSKPKKIVGLDIDHINSSVQYIKN